MGQDPAVAARDIWRARGARPVLRGLSLTVASGGSVAILGANGSGKTTLLRVLAALLRPTRGTVRIHGEDPYASPAARRRIGYVGHEPMLYGGLTVLENLSLFAALYGLDRPRHHAQRACELVGLGAYRRTPVRHLSRGLLQRAALARALLHGPDVVLLDEPTTGLDADALECLVGLLRELRGRGATVLFTTHSPQEASRIAEEAYVLAGGTLRGPQEASALSAEAMRAQPPDGDPIP